MKKNKCVSRVRVMELMEANVQGVPMFINSEEAAAVMGMTGRALQNRRFRKLNSPPYLKVGRLVRYRLDEVVSWMNYEAVPGF